MRDFIVGTLIRIAHHLTGRPSQKTPSEPLMYRPEIFRQLTARFPNLSSNAPRIMEIGPKDGLDSRRLQSLHPSEIVFIDLPEKRDGNQAWLADIDVPHTYLEGNIIYLTGEVLRDLGSFDLIYCLGVLYHNAEQLRLLRTLYRLARPGGVLALESATTRNWLLQGLPSPAVELHYPQTYRDTGTVTHLPNARAIAAWLHMAGWRCVLRVQPYDRYNPNLRHQRATFFAQRLTAADDGYAYYARSGQNSRYVVGDAQV